MTQNKRINISNKILFLIFIMAYFVFSFIMIFSFCETSVISPNNYVGELIIYKNDNIIINIISVFLFLILFVLFRKLNLIFKFKVKYVYIFLFIYVLIIGSIWAFSVTSIPAADSYNVFDAAIGVINHDYSPMLSNNTFYAHEFYNDISYFNYYPFQLPFVFICEIIYRIFESGNAIIIQLINVICVGFAYVVIMKITRLLFEDEDLEYIVAFLLIGCIQPILYVTFVYGNIIGMCFALWSAYFFIKYLKNNNSWHLLITSFLLMISIMAKYNNMIYFIAFIIIILISSIRKFQLDRIAFLILTLFMVFGTKELIIKRYEVMANTKFTSGLSQLLYLDMGINESSMAPGWYSTIAKDIYFANNLDIKNANREALINIKQRINIFTNDIQYATSFFSRKVLSQWNETTYESIWISKVKGHRNEVNAIGRSVYDGALGKVLISYFDFYMQIIYLFFVLGIYFLIIKKKINLQNTILVLVLLGAFVYHFLFEGKSQYIFTYIILLIPYVAYALNVIADKIKKYS